MTEILKSVHKAELQIEAAAARFFSRHTLLGWVMAFIGMPFFVLAAVSACSTALFLPFALLFGWL